MSGLARVPPGRAGLIWLRERLAVAQSGRDQLDRKRRALLIEQQGRRERREAVSARWTTSSREAATWLLRASLLGGQDALRRAPAGAPARVDLEWATAFGLRYPVSAQLVTPAVRDGADDGAVGVPGPALAEAIAAHRQALRDAIDLAVADEAARRIDADCAPLTGAGYPACRRPWPRPSWPSTRPNRRRRPGSAGRWVAIGPAEPAGRSRARRPRAAARAHRGSSRSVEVTKAKRRSASNRWSPGTGSSASDPTTARQRCSPA